MCDGLGKKKQKGGGYGGVAAPVGRKKKRPTTWKVWQQRNKKMQTQDKNKAKGVNFPNFIFVVADPPAHSKSNVKPIK